MTLEFLEPLALLRRAQTDARPGRARALGRGVQYRYLIDSGSRDSHPPPPTPSPCPSYGVSAGLRERGTVDAELFLSAEGQCYLRDVRFAPCGEEKRLCGPA